MDTEKLVDDAMKRMHRSTDDNQLMITGLPTDVNEVVIANVFRSGCGCSKASGKPCATSSFPLHSVRAPCAELACDELHMALLGQLATCRGVGRGVSGGFWKPPSELKNKIIIRWFLFVGSDLTHQVPQIVVRVRHECVIRAHAIL